MKNLKLTLKELAGPLMTVSFSLLSAAGILFILSANPFQAVTHFFAGPFLNLYNFGNMLSSSAPLILCGLGMMITFKASEFNLGGEGQVYAGALAATVFCLFIPGIGGFSGVFLALISAALSGAILAGISGLLKAKWNTNELLSSYLISAGFVLVVDYLITGPLDDPASNLLATRTIATPFWLPRIMPPSHLGSGIFIALAVAALTAFFLFKTRAGYELSICGLNNEFAMYGGINISFYLVFSMVLGGALQGLAGGISILGTYHRCIKGFSSGLGWNGIAIALIGRNRPVGVILGSMLYAYLDAGAQAAMIHSGISTEIATLIKAAVLFLITARSPLWIPRKGIIRHRGASPLLGIGRRKR